MKTDGSDAKDKTKEATPEEQARKTLQHQIEKMAGQFENALPNKIGVERMMRIVMTAILNNPKLAQCEPNSFFGSLLQALQLGLEVNTPLGQAWLIPRWDGKAKKLKCQFQMGYQGLVDLCYRYGTYRRITAEVVYEGDIFDYKNGTTHYIEHIQKFKTETPKYVWALYETENGGQNFVVWTWDKVMKHAEAFSESYDSDKDEWKYSAWSSNQESKESMAKKTMLERVLKYAPKSVELKQALIADDNAIIARAVTEGGETKFQFDIEEKIIPAIEDDRDNPNLVKEKPPATAGNGKPEKETVPAAGKETEKPNTQQQTASAAPAGNTLPKNNGAGTGNKGGLFSADEEAALAEQLRNENAAIPQFED